MASNDKRGPSIAKGPKRKLKSDVWNFFAYLPSSGPDGEDEAKCIRCGSKLKAGGKKYGTRHLWRHKDSRRCTAIAEQRISDLLEQANNNGTLFSSPQHP